MPSYETASCYSHFYLFPFPPPIIIDFVFFLASDWLTITICAGDPPPKSPEITSRGGISDISSALTPSSRNVSASRLSSRERNNGSVCSLRTSWSTESAGGKAVDERFFSDIFASYVMNSLQVLASAKLSEIDESEGNKFEGQVTFLLGLKA